MPHQCPFCERANPADAKFCNACGAPLHLLPCPQCGAVNDAAATSCHQCAAPLPGPGPGPGPGKSALASSSGGQAIRGGGAAFAPMPAADADALDRDAKVFATLQELRQLLAQSESGLAGRAPDRGGPVPGLDVMKAIRPLQADAPSYPAPAVAIPTAEPLPPTRRVVLPRRAVIVAGAVLMAAVAVYLASGQRQSTSVPRAPAAAGEVKGGGTAEASPRVTLNATAEAAPVAPGPASVPRVTPGVVPSPASPPPTASVSPGPASPPPAASVAPAQPTSAPRISASVQREGQGGGGIPAAPAPVATARPGAPTAPPAGTGIERPAPPRIGPCTDAVAALGLCTRESTQRRE